MAKSNKNKYTDIKTELSNKSDSTLFDKILGYEDIKEELSLIRNWLLDPDTEKDNKVFLPKGILFYGDSGTGKTLFASEFAKSFNWPIVVIEGDDSNGVIKDIQEKFKKAREYNHAIVVMDELDLLLDNSNAILRTLLTEIDGFNKDDSGKILVLATSNHFYRIPNTLLRSGRFDRLIEIKIPDHETKELLFRKFLDQYNIKYPDVDFIDVVRTVKQVNGADVKSICNDLYLRNLKTVQTEDIIWSYERVINNKYRKTKEANKDFKIALHESGHILAALRYNDYVIFHDAKFIDKGARTYLIPKPNVVSSFENVLKNVNITLAGAAAETIIYKSFNVGSSIDFNQAIVSLRRLIEREGYSGFRYLSKDYDSNNNVYVISERAIRRKEKIVNKLLRRQFKTIKKYLKQNCKDLLKIANYLKINGKITYKDLSRLKLNCLKNINFEIENIKPSILPKPALALESGLRTKRAADALRDYLESE